MRSLFVLATLLAGCPDRSVSKLDPVQTGEVQKDIPVSADVDVLFVIDNSASTNDKQQAFATNFPRFVQALDAFPLGRPNIHMGVISTTVDVGADVGSPVCHPASSEDGRLQSTAHGTCTPPTGRFISDIKDAATGMRRTNYTDTLENTFACIAKLGSTGCGFEAPLEAIKRALDGSRPENAGFIRDGAYLAVVILTDEDDCSVADKNIFSLSNVGPGDFRCQPMYAYQCDTPINPNTPATYTNCKPRTGSYLHDVGEYYSFLTALKGSQKVVVALIGGDPSATIMTGPLAMQSMALQPSCRTTLNGMEALGRPANRLSAFEQQFGDHGIFRTVCQPDYSQALADIGALLFRAISPCIEGDLVTTDVDPKNPGTQLDCHVSDVTNPDTSHQTESPIPACAMMDDSTPSLAASKPCWWTKENPMCGTATNLELHVERSSPPATGTSVRVRCESQ